jgi:hypothetical protein
MVQNQESAANRERSRSMLSFVLFLVFFLGALPSVFAQNFEQEFKRIERLQDRSAYDSALLLANQLLAREGRNTENVHSLLLNKQISFYYLGQYDSMRRQSCAFG